jgi:hypothetical protein
MIWSKRLSEEEWIVATECLRAAALGPFFGTDLHPITGCTADELMDIYRRRDELVDGDEEAERAIGQCVLHFIGYPHKRSEEMKDWLAADGQMLARIADKWFHQGRPKFAPFFEARRKERGNQ